MDVIYIISQIFVALGYLMLGIGIRKEKRIHILIYFNIYNFFLMLSYLLLGAFSGIIALCVSFFRNFIFMYDEKENKSTPNYVMFIFAIITVLLTIVFYEGPIDLFPCVLTVITIFTSGSRSTKINRLGSLFASICWIIYAIAFKSIFAIICELYLAICTTIGLIKYNLKRKDKKYV